MNITRRKLFALGGGAIAAVVGVAVGTSKRKRPKARATMRRVENTGECRLMRMAGEIKAQRRRSVAEYLK